MKLNLKKKSYFLRFSRKTQTLHNTIYYMISIIRLTADTFRREAPTATIGSPSDPKWSNIKNWISQSLPALDNISSSTLIDGTQSDSVTIKAIETRSIPRRDSIGLSNWKLDCLHRVRYKWKMSLSDSVRARVCPRVVDTQFTKVNRKLNGICDIASVGSEMIAPVDTRKSSWTQIE